MRVFLARRFVLFTLLAAFALRLTQLTFQPLWYDEGWSVWFATSDLETMLARTAVDIHPPLYYALLHFWIALAGSGEFALRYFSVVTGVLIVAALYGLARTLAGEGAARWSALLGAIAPLEIFYAQEIRMYGLVTLLAICSTWLFWRALHDGKRAAWAAYVLITAAALHTQYYAAFVPLAHGLYALGAFAARRAGKPAQWLAAFAAAGALFLPWAFYAGDKLAAYVGDKVAIEQYAPLAPHDYLARHLAAFSVGHLAPDMAWLGWFALGFGVLALWGALGGGRRAAYLLACLLVPLAAGWLVQLRLPFAPPRMERLLLLASPAFLVLMAMGLDRIGRERRAFLGKGAGIASSQKPLLAMTDGAMTEGEMTEGEVASPPPAARNDGSSIDASRQLLAMTVTVLVAACGASLIALFVTPRYPEQDYRPLAARIGALALPTDAVVCVHPWQVGFLRAYLSVPVALDLVAAPAWGNAVRAQLDAPLAANRRVWVPAFQTLGRVLEGEMEQYLRRAAFNVEAVWYGQTRLLFFAPPVPLASEMPSDWLKLSVDRKGAPRESGWGIVPIEVALFHSGTPPLRPRLGARLKDAQGRVWAAHDREFDQVTRDTRPGNENAWRFESRLGFLIPASTPPGDYRIAVTFYDELTGNVLRAETEILSVEVARPHAPVPAAALPIGTPLIADWRGARLLGFTMREGEWKPGESLHLDLFWQATGAATGERLLFAQVQGADGAPRAASEGATTQPFSAWRAGDLVREQRDLRLPASLPPGDYRVAIGWLDAASGARVPLSGSGDQLALRTIAVVARPHRMTPPESQARTDWRFGTAARVAGYDLALDAARGTLSVRLSWQALEETGMPYKVFVHVVPPAGGAPVAQHDAEPADGAFPTTAWIRDEYIDDEHAVTLPAGLPAGHYRILVGMYDPQTGARLPAFAADGSRAAGDAAPLATVDLK